MAEMAELRVDGKTFKLPVVEGTEGERAVDISNLRSETGLITLDPGYGNTGSCSSSRKCRSCATEKTHTSPLRFIAIPKRCRLPWPARKSATIASSGRTFTLPNTSR